MIASNGSVGVANSASGDHGQSDRLMEIGRSSQGDLDGEWLPADSQGVDGGCWVKA
jgi:hypothetical protein